MNCKTQINKESFEEIQNEVIGKVAKWKGSRDVKIPFSKSYKYLYFNSKLKNISIGTTERTFLNDDSKKVSVQEFIKFIKGSN